MRARGRELDTEWYNVGESEEEVRERMPVLREGLLAELWLWLEAVLEGRDVGGKDGRDVAGQGPQCKDTHTALGVEIN